MEAEQNKDGKPDLSQDSEADRACAVVGDQQTKLMDNSEAPTTGLGESGTSGHSQSKTLRPVRLKNWDSGSLNYDTLHLQALQTCPCSNVRCLGSLVFPSTATPVLGNGHQQQLHRRAADLLLSYYTSINRAGSPAHQQRWAEVEKEIEQTGTYQLTSTELTFGAKQAWRNAVRCVGRIQWTRLQLFDARDCSSVQEMFNSICNHIRYSTNKGNIRSTITVFPQRAEGRGDFRIWNSQFIRYAGFPQEDGTVLGDGANVELTELCLRLGWNPVRSRFTVLPLLLQANGEDPELFEIPPELILEVPIQHPQCEQFSLLGLRWYGLPAVANMMLEVGGLEFPAAPFNGWYTAPEISARNFCDSSRYGLLKEIAAVLGLDTRSTLFLWKDKAAIEATVAVLYSFQRAKVTIVDHHTITESFMKHLESEQRLRGGCPTDWVWVVPPISGSLTPVFHQEFLNYNLSPSFSYQTDAWRTHKWSNGISVKRKTIGFKELAKAVEFSTKLMAQALARRVKVTILYATETGKSETLARKLCDIFCKVFNPKLLRMDEYDIVNLEHESLVLVVASTFGNGDPPENGEAFADLLMKMTHPDSSPTEYRSYKARFNSLSDDEFEAFSEMKLEETSFRRLGPLASVRFAVFGLGSRAYPHFCAFARAVDTRLEELGAERLLTLGEGDELCGQEDQFRAWSRNTFKAACEVFCIEDSAETEEDGDSSFESSAVWRPDHCRLSMVAQGPDLVTALSQLHRRSTFQMSLLSRQNLQHESSGRSTILVRLRVSGVELSYQPGDHVGIHPANSEAEVERLLERLQDLPPHNDLVCLQRLQHRAQGQGNQQTWVQDSRLPACTVTQALTHFLDINTPPSPDFLQLLAQLAEDPTDRQQLETLSQGTHRYEEWKWENNPTVAGVLQEFPSARPPASLLLSQLPLLQPRYYSISSSPDAHPGQIHATVAVLEYRTKGGTGPVRQGVCSSWLNRLSPDDSVFCFIRRAPLFRLPSDPSVPCILVGPGTGIAPFRSFWQQRLFELENRGGGPCAMTLIFGCRYSDKDHIYKEEMMRAKKRGVFREIYAAYSREQEGKKVYVQDIIRNQLSEELFWALDSQKGHLYICGDVTMAQDVSQTVQEIIAAQGSLSLTEAAAYIARLKDENRYHEDIFGLTLRTREVTTKVRSASFTYWQQSKGGSESQ
ncbi:nitric oxide synthase 1-like [Mobula birostris]|uniref:nitric oxide synthase 1-like n=1 Tax=Mobula birostris TaxID=1983395 RepID=UPI003B284495